MAGLLSVRAGARCCHQTASILVAPEGKPLLSRFACGKPTSRRCGGQDMRSIGMRRRRPTRDRVLDIIGISPVKAKCWPIRGAAGLLKIAIPSRAATSQRQPSFVAEFLFPRCPVGRATRRGDRPLHHRRSTCGPELAPDGLLLAICSPFSYDQSDRWFGRMPDFLFQSRALSSAARMSPDCPRPESYLIMNCAMRTCASLGRVASSALRIAAARGLQ